MMKRKGLTSLSGVPRPVGWGLESDNPPPYYEPGGPKARGNKKNLIAPTLAASSAPPDRPVGGRYGPATGATVRETNAPRNPISNGAATAIDE
jgi:hypothetical protein